MAVYTVQTTEKIPALPEYFALAIKALFLSVGRNKIATIKALRSLQVDPANFEYVLSGYDTNKYSPAPLDLKTAKDMVESVMEFYGLTSF